MKIKEFLLGEIGRAEAYKLLSECYYLPDEKLIKALNDLDSEAGQLYSEIGGYVPRIKDIELLKTDYSRLFVGPFRLLAPPYGSVYLEQDRRLMGESTMDVQKRYREEGLNIVIKEAPDHIVVELEFLHFLVVKEVEAIRNARWKDVASYMKKQKDFLRIHLGMWVSRFAQDIEENSETKFYKCLARATKFFLEGDMSHIQSAELRLSSECRGEDHIG